MGIPAIIFTGRINSRVMFGLPRLATSIVRQIKESQSLLIDFRSSSAPRTGMSPVSDAVKNAMILKNVRQVTFFSTNTIPQRSSKLAETFIIKAMRHLARHGLKPLPVPVNGLIITIDGSDAKVQIL